MYISDNLHRFTQRSDAVVSSSRVDECSEHVSIYLLLFYIAFDIIIIIAVDKLRHTRKAYTRTNIPDSFFRLLGDCIGVSM